MRTASRTPTVRDAAARSSALWTIMPVLFLGLLLVLLAALLVRAMFQPLQRLAERLGERHEHDLGGLDRAALPSELWPFVTEINKLIARTMRALVLQRRFIADAAHELRSPMTAISLLAERLAASAMPDEARERLGALSAGLSRTRILLDQLLTLARTQESPLELPTQVPLKKAILECLEDLVPLAEAKAIDLGMVGDADPLVTGRPVDIGVAEDGGEIGSGLGLAITSSIANQIGARITLMERPDGARGLRARVRFPRAAAAALAD